MDPNTVAQLEALDLTEAELRADPCMASCCLRDVQEQREVTLLKAKLLSQDPTTRRQRMRERAMQPLHAAAQVQGTGEAVSDDLATPSDSDEDSTMLQDIRAKRMRQLQQEARAKEQQSQQGLGHLTDVPEGKLLELLESQEGCCVCHLAVSGYQPCDELDQQLERLAHQWRGTRFLRCAVRRRSAVLRALDVAGAPVLLCVREGAVIGRAPFEAFGPPGDVYEEEVVGYLKRLSVLRHTTRSSPVQQGLPGDPGSRSDSGTEDETSSGRGGGGGLRTAPCETCGRCYPHTHVKAVYSSQLSHAQDEDSDFD